MLWVGIRVTWQQYSINIFFFHRLKFGMLLIKVNIYQDTELWAHIMYRHSKPNKRTTQQPASQLWLLYSDLLPKGKQSWLWRRLVFTGRGDHGWCVCVISTFGFGCYGNNQIKSRTWTERRLSPKKKRWVNSNLNFHVFVSEVLQGKTVQIEGDLACSAFNPKPCSGYLLKHFTSLLCWRNIGGTKTHKQCKVCELLLNCITSSFICHCDCMSVNLWYFMRISFFLPLCSCGSDTAFLSKTVNLLSQKNVLMMEPTDHQLLFH